MTLPDQLGGERIIAQAGSAIHARRARGELKNAHRWTQDIRRSARRDGSWACDNARCESDADRDRGAVWIGEKCAGAAAGCGVGRGSDNARFVLSSAVPSVAGTA